MAYSLTGDFLESCDCTVICPCWVDDDPTGGHCTGFILWKIDVGSLDYLDANEQKSELDVSGCEVVSVSTHSGNRRRGGATTSVLYIDPGRQGPADLIVKALGWAFAGQTTGILAEISEVSGTVVGVYPAKITSPPNAKGVSNQPWRVRVEEFLGADRGILRIDAKGRPKAFDKEELAKDKKRVQPMTLRHTALSYELQANGPVQAQQGDELTIRVGALPGGNLEVFGRSGMRGEFKYTHKGPSGRPEQASIAS